MDDDNDGIPDYADPSPLHPALNMGLEGLYKGSFIREGMSVQ